MMDVNIFDSSNPIYDPSLGSPNENCDGGGPGIGNGGSPDDPLSNCDPLGNLVIIHDPNSTESEPNGNESGGCLFFKFERLVELVNMGFLNTDKAATITASCLLPLNAGIHVRIAILTFCIGLPFLVNFALV